MARATAAKPMTAEELLDLPRGRFRYELVKGELKKLAPAGFEHGKVVSGWKFPVAEIFAA